MNLGLYRTSLAAAVRLSLVIKVSFTGMMDKTSKNFSTHTDSLNPRKNLAIADEPRPPNSLKTSQPSYDDEYPSLSAAVRHPKSKRRTWIDLGGHSEQKSANVVGNGGPSNIEASASTSHDNDTCLPTKFGKKAVPFTSRNSNHRHNEEKRISPGIDKDEPFDICLPKARKCRGPKSAVNKTSRVMWVPKVQSGQEDGEQNCDMETENDTECPAAGTGKVLRPGMVLLKNYIPLKEQVEIVKRCQGLGLGPGGFYRPGYSDGAKLRLYMMCLGLDWNAQTRKYGERREHDNAAPPDIPHEFTSMVSRVLDDSHAIIQGDSNAVNVEDILPRMCPDVCIVNFYTTNGRLGLHQDRDESPDSLAKGLPVVSISVGDSAEFLYGDHRDVDKAESVELESGDVLIFGGESRHIFHGVTSIYPNTAPRSLVEISNLRPGRLNLTFRKY